MARTPVADRAQDERFMRRAFDLARRALGDTSPNPVVGAVVVKRGRVVGEGYHRRAGLPHAEVEALQRAGRQAAGATLYVNLEPCNHVGRTPPCCDAVLAAGVARVVVAMRDPNPLVNGAGIRRLRQAGVTVDADVLRDDALRLNAPFVKSIRRGLPWVVAKIAQSLDGKIATRTGESRWITSEPARRFAHQLRRRADAVIVGINTVLRDDPLLTVRAVTARPGRPIRVVVDSRLRTPLSSRCVRDRSAATVIATTVNSAAKRGRFERRGIEVLRFRPARGRVPLSQLLRELAERYGATSVLFEGGGELLAGAFAEQLIDEVAWCVAPIVIGGSRAPTAVAGEGIARLADAARIEQVTVRRLGPDTIIEGLVAYPKRGRGR